VAGKKKLDQRNEVENHPQAGGMQCDAAEKVAGAAEREERVDQPNKVATQCEAQPKQCHKLGKYQSPLSLLQVPSDDAGFRNPIPSTHYILHSEGAEGKRQGSRVVVTRITQRSFAIDSTN